MTKTKIKKTALIAIIGGFTAVASMLPFLRGKQTKEPIPPEALTEAIKANWNDNSPTAMSNIVKNINFPFFMAVDKNGQYSSEKAQKIIDSLNIDKNRNACISFFDGTYNFDDFCHALIGDDKAKEEKLAPVLNELKNYPWGETKGSKESTKTIYYDIMMIGSGILIPLSLMMLLGGYFGSVQEESIFPALGAGAFAIGLMYCGTTGIDKYEKLGNELRLGNYRADLVEQALHTVQRDMYDAYVRHTIDGEKTKIIQLNQEQSKQMMKWIQQNRQFDFYGDMLKNFER